MIDESHIAFTEKILESQGHYITLKTTAYLVISSDRIDTVSYTGVNSFIKKDLAKLILKKLYASNLNDITEVLQTFSRDPSLALELLQQLHTRLTNLTK